VETTTAGLSGLVGDRQIRDLPLNGRNFVQLALLESGVVLSREAQQNSVTGVGLKLNFNGARTDANNYMMDGTTINSVNQQAIGGTSGQAMGVETIQEFQVLTSNYSAEFGRAGGGVINVVTKSGTNELHGSLFEFLRNSDLDARNFFDGARVPAFKRNQFGGTLGGPIKKDKTFIFGGYEGLQERLGKTLIGNVPTLNARQGIFPTGNVIVNPVVLPYLPLWPLPNGRDFGNGIAEFDRTASQPTGQNFGQVRVDHNFSDKDSFFGRYTIDDSSQQVPSALPNNLAKNSVRSQNAAIGETRIFSPRLLNVFRFAFNRSTADFYTAIVNSIEADPTLFFLPNPVVPGVGTLGVQGVTEGAGSGALTLRLDNVFQFTDTVSYTSGRQSLKFGGEFQRIQTNENNPNQGTGAFVFANLTNFLLAQPASFSGIPAGSTFVRGWRQDLVGMFVQDDIRLRPHFTLNLGLRWEFTTNPNEVNGRSSHYVGLFTTDTIVVGNPLYKTPKANFAPRFGFAWDVFGDGKTSLRGGFGVYDSMLFRNYYFASRLLPPFVTSIAGSAPNITFPHPLASLGPNPAQAPSLVQYQDNKQPYMLHWDLSVEREILRGTVLTVGYVGSRGLHLGRFDSLDVAIPQILSDGRYFYALGLPRRDPNFSSLTLKQLAANSRYHSLQAGVTHQLSKGLQIQGSYTWSHSMDNSSAQTGVDYLNGSTSPQNPWDIKHTEWGNSDYDLRHVLTANATYLLPIGGATKGVLGKLVQGWQTNGILNVSSGAPFDIENSSGLNQDRSGGVSAGNTSGGATASRPDLLLTPGCSGNPVLGGPDHYFNINCFQLQTPGFYGNLGRNTAVGPGLMSVDFALVKNTAIGEKKNLQFRAEAFNLFNRANFDLPNHTVFLSANGLPSATAGRITGTVTSSRQLQFSLKLAF